MKRVLVTGSSRGIGKEIAENLLADGFSVTLHARSGTSSTLVSVSEELSQKYDREVPVLGFDVSDTAAAEKQLLSEVEARGAYYGVVLCAGITKDAPFPALSWEDWDSVIKVNLYGFFNVLRPLILPMIQLRAGGRIVALSSLSGVIGNRGQVAYSASKAGIIGAAKALSRELAKRKITVNCVAPGPVTTDMLSCEVADHMKKVIPLGRPATAVEVSSAVRYLFKDEAAYLTGQVLNLNGGLV